MARKRASTTAISSPSKLLKTTHVLPISNNHLFKKEVIEAHEGDVEDILQRRPPRHDWRTVYDAIRSFRDVNEAPVDTMGCERLADTTAEPKHFRFQSLVALMLSSQTKDAITADAVRKLQSAFSPLSALTIVNAEDAALNRCIEKVGFHRKKTVYLKQAANICLEEYGGDIPKDIQGLVALPGVGPKMAYLAMQCAWNVNQGIGVDVHVHRISNRLGWVKTKQPEETRRALEAWLPKALWQEINPMLVGFGQVHCLPVKPKCETCPVRFQCPSAPRSVKRSPKAAEVVDEKASFESSKDEPSI